jgi:hypothetical protein
MMVEHIYDRDRLSILTFIDAFLAELEKGNYVLYSGIPSFADNPTAHSSKPNDQAWRELMSPKELAEYDSGRHNNRASSPDSNRTSRNKRLVTLIDNDTNSRANPTTPEHSMRATEMTAWLKSFASFPGHCVSCGQYLAQNKRGGIVFPPDDDMPNLDMFCSECFNALQIRKGSDDWFAKLPKLDQKIWQLLKTGLTQKQIAARLTVGSQRVTQQMVSDTKQKILRMMKEFRRDRYGSRSQ